MVEQITTFEQLNRIFMDDDKGNVSRLIVIDFSAEWCGPCKVIAPHFEILAQKYSAVEFYKIDINNKELKDFCGFCKIGPIPCFCFFMNGEHVDRVVGADIVAVENMIIHKFFSHNTQSMQL